MLGHAYSSRAAFVLGPLLLVQQPTPAATLLYDVLQPQLLPPPGGCRPWSQTSEQDQYWRDGKPPAGAGRSCAQQGRGNPAANW